MLSTIGSIASQDSLITWDRYNAITTHNYTWGGNFVYQTKSSNPNGDKPVDYSFSASVGFTVFNIATTFTVYYSLASSSSLLKYSWNFSIGEWEVYKATAYDAPTYSKGVLAQADIRAVAGTYPDNGLHIDGYWYVKKV